MPLKVSVSMGNGKMGAVASVSLPPILSCGAALPCYKGCYAAKLARLRPVVRDAWLNNWKLVVTDRDAYFAQIRALLGLRKTPRLFRWHVAGDFPDYDYLRRALGMASDFPETRFAAFTKKYDLLRVMRRNKDTRPVNLSLIASAWPGLVMPPDIRRNFPTAWMRDPKMPDLRIPEAALECGGGCDKCFKCWDMGPGESVVFHKH